jgi:hypothetical protein
LCGVHRFEEVVRRDVKSSKYDGKAAARYTHLGEAVVVAILAQRAGQAVLPWFGAFKLQ